MIRQKLPVKAQTKLILFQTSPLREKLAMIAEWFSAIISIPALIYGLLPVVRAAQRGEISSVTVPEFTGAVFSFTPAALFVVVYFSRKMWREEILSRFSSRKILDGLGGDAFKRKIFPGDTGRFDHYGYEFGWTDPSLNYWIADQSNSLPNLNFNLGGTYYSYRPIDGTDAKAHQLQTFALHRKLRGGAKIFNDSKIRMAGDLFVGRTQDIPLEKTDYVSSLMSDQLAFQVISDTKTGYVLQDGFSHFLEESSNGEDRDPIFVLKPLSRSNVSNQIGVSTIAFTTDGFIPFVMQTRANSQSQGKLAPSGSGSLDWSDVEKQAFGCSFWSLIRYGATRELFEECGIGERLNLEKFSRDNVRIYAFSRMMHRAGKPEFFAVSRLPFTINEISAMRIRGGERAYTIRSRASDGPPVEVGSDVRKGIIDACSFYSDEKNISRILKSDISLSYPLHHGLDLLVETVRDDRTGKIISDFIGENLMKR